MKVRLMGTNYSIAITLYNQHLLHNGKLKQETFSISTLHVDINRYLTNRSDSCTVKVGWFWHDGGQFGPLKRLQVDLPQVGQDLLSIISPTYKHLWG